jgi:hypothetical protein
MIGPPLEWMTFTKESKIFKIYGEKIMPTINSLGFIYSTKITYDKNQDKQNIRTKYDNKN